MDRQKTTLVRSLVALPVDPQLRTSGHSTDLINFCANLRRAGTELSTVNVTSVTGRADR